MLLEFAKEVSMKVLFNVKGLLLKNSDDSISSSHYIPIAIWGRDSSVFSCFEDGDFEEYPVYGTAAAV